MLANLNDVLVPAKRGRYAVGLFNSVNLELARAIIQAAERLRAPVILGTAEVLLPFGPLEELSWFLVPMAKRASVPVVVHFDHGMSMQLCENALRLGFTSIMYDASWLPYDENVRDTREMAAMAHGFGATIEAELGHIGSSENSAEGSAQTDMCEECFTDPVQARDFVRSTGVDALAVAVGTVHGHYRAAPRLDFSRIASIAQAVEVPLVLHGGSGLSDVDFARSIELGISKVNIFTDINCAAASACDRALRSGKTALTDLIPLEVEAVESSVAEKIRLFGSEGKAGRY